MPSDCGKSIVAIRPILGAHELKPFCQVPRVTRTRREVVTQVLAFSLMTSTGILIGIYFSVNWEFDAATRAEQALYIAQRGAY